MQIQPFGPVLSIFATPVQISVQESQAESSSQAPEISILLFLYLWCDPAPLTVIIVSISSTLSPGKISRPDLYLSSNRRMSAKYRPHQAHSIGYSQYSSYLHRQIPKTSDAGWHRTPDQEEAQTSNAIHQGSHFPLQGCTWPPPHPTAWWSYGTSQGRPSSRSRNCRPLP